MKVVITKRDHDYHAAIENESLPAGTISYDKWGCGKSVYAAIGNLVSCHPEDFDITIEAAEQE